MSRVKRIPGDSWDFGEPPVALVKVARDGLVGRDRSAFIKRAGAAAPAFLSIFDNVKFATDEEPIHLIALGAGEHWSANRNGDRFLEKELQNHHDTFVKHARFYRGHNNKPDSPSFGIVKASVYNDDMHRVELLVGLNKTKTAAERNGGFVADKELERLAKDGNLPVSMACVVDPATPVLTGYGYKPIADVCPGDVVYTHAGNWKKVTGLNRRVYTGEVVELSLRGLAPTLKLTADHPMFAMAADAEDAGFNWRAAGDLAPGDYVHVAAIKSAAFNHSDPANSVERFDLSAAEKLKYLAALLRENGGPDARGVAWGASNLNDALHIRDLLLSLGIAADLFSEGSQYEVITSICSLVPLRPFYVPPAKYADINCDDAEIWTGGGSDFAYPVVCVTRGQATGIMTYNFEVEEDHSYSLMGTSSHNCKIAFDKCSACGNISKTKEEYCTAKTCPGGGCAENMGRVVKLGGDLHLLCVDNPNPLFFDISHVFRPADRTAYGAPADWLQKSAAFEPDDADTPTAFLTHHSDPVSSEMMKIAYRIHENEASIVASAPTHLAQSLSTDRLLPIRVSEKLAAVMGAMADRQALLSLKDFAESTGAGSHYRAARAKLAGVIGRMAEDGSLSSYLQDARLPDRGEPLPRGLAESVEKAASLRSMTKSAVAARLGASTLGAGSIYGYEDAGDAGAAEKLARRYMAYKVAALQRMSETDKNFDLTFRTAVLQDVA